MTQKIKILIIGGGFGGVYTLKNLYKAFHGNKNIELSIINDKNYFLFTPLLHEVATGGINPQNIIEPIRRVLRHCLRNFYLGKTESINLKERLVKVADINIPYDYLVIATGAETNFYDIKGAKENSFTLKSIDDAIKLKNHAISQMEKATHTTDRQKRKNVLQFVVVGGGPTGVELVAELQEFIIETFSHFYRKEIVEDVSITLIERGENLIPSFGVKMGRKSLEVLKKKGVKVMLKTSVEEVTTDKIILNNGEVIPTETTIWVAGIKPANLEFTETVEKSPNGRLLVNEYLQLEDHDEVFAIGDVASFKQNNTILPALAQVAEKQAKAVAENIKLLVEGKKPKTFFYHSTGNMLSIGRWAAIAEIANFTFFGRITWWVWRTVYLSKLISWRKKVEVALDWTIDLFAARDISEI